MQTTITTVLFDLHGVLVDPAIVRAQQPAAQGAFLAERYGGEPAEWVDAYRAIRADWESYWADLDLDGEHGIDDLWEGEVRVLRAHFRLTGRPYPPARELEQLARERRYWVLRRINAAYPDARPAVIALKRDGFRLGVVSNAPLAHCRGLLEGAGLLGHFDGNIVGCDVVGSFSKGPDTYRFALAQIGSRAEASVVFDDNADGVLGARRAGIHAVLIARAGRTDPRPLSEARRMAAAVLPDLSAAPAYVRTLNGRR